MNIRVDGVEISAHEVGLEMQHHPAPDLQTAQQEAARALVVRTLLLQEARRRDLWVGDDPAGEEPALRALMEQAVAVPEVDEAACRAHFEAHQERFRGPDLFAPSHILFAARADDIEGRIAAKAAADATLAELSEHPERFEHIARERSACPSGAGGGSLGQIQKGETLGEFERALRATPVATICPTPIETDHGFHVLRVDARAEGKPVPYASVADRLRIYLRDRDWRRRVQVFIAQLAQQAVIEGFDMGHQSVPRPGSAQGAAQRGVQAGEGGPARAQ